MPHAHTGLMRGDASKIARIHRLSVHHVIEVAAGRRKTEDAKLRATIARYREKAARTQPPTGSPSDPAAA